MALNGGPLFRFTPAVSLFVILEDRGGGGPPVAGPADGGTVTDAARQYDWSAAYGWLADRWGLNWQVALGKHADVGRTVTPSLLFAGDAAGQAEAAIDHYVVGLPAPRSTGSMRHDGSGKDAAGTVDARPVPHRRPGGHGDGQRRGRRRLHRGGVADGQLRGPGRDRPPLVGALGRAEAEACGWVKDRFGVSWQIVPRALWGMMASGDRRRGSG